MKNRTNPIERRLAELGERLRQRRLDRNLTQAALASAAGVSPKTVANAEDGQNVSVETLLALLDALGRLGEIDQLLADDGPSPVQLAERRGRRRRRASGERSERKSEDWEW